MLTSWINQERGYSPTADHRIWSYLGLNGDEPDPGASGVEKALLLLTGGLPPESAPEADNILGMFTGGTGTHGLGSFFGLPAQYGPYGGLMEKPQESAGLFGMLSSGTGGLGGLGGVR